MSNSDDGIISMDATHLDKVVLIHQEAFPDFFMTLLGAPFLRAYYSSILKFENSIALVHVGRNGDLDGFAVGCVGPENFYKSMISRPIGICWGILVGLFRRPYLLKRIINNVIRVKKSKVLKGNELRCELSSIGVSTSGSGIGKALVGRFVILAFETEAKELVLTTDLNNNDGVIAFYKGKGFVQSGIDVRGNREMIQFRLRNPKHREN